MAVEWEDRVDEALTAMHQSEPADVIEKIAELAFEVPESRGCAWLKRRAGWLDRREETKQLYSAFIVSNEGREAARLLALSAPHGTRFLEVAGEKARVGYQRVADMFDHVDFSRCRRFTMVGSGPLPVTALHVMERTGVPDCLVLDCSQERLHVVDALRLKFGWAGLRPVLCDGASFDYGGSDVVYVANMVQPKGLTVRRILDSAPSHVQVVVREPYSLGCLWAESAEQEWGQGLEVVGRGPVSRHLSRDIYLRRAGVNGS